MDFAGIFFFSAGFLVRGGYLVPGRFLVVRGTGRARGKGYGFHRVWRRVGIRGNGYRVHHRYCFNLHESCGFADVLRANAACVHAFRGVFGTGGSGGPRQLRIRIPLPRVGDFANERADLFANMLELTGPCSRGSGMKATERMSL